MPWLIGTRRRGSATLALLRWEPAQDLAEFGFDGTHALTIIGRLAQQDVERLLAGELDDAVRAVVEHFARGPRQAYRLTKPAINAATLQALDKAMEREAEARPGCCSPRFHRGGNGHAAEAISAIQRLIRPKELTVVDPMHTEEHLALAMACRPFVGPAYLRARTHRSPIARPCFNFLLAPRSGFHRPHGSQGVRRLPVRHT
jgi:hypothetical protein